jgi:hypothetical protein
MIKQLTEVNDENEKDECTITKKFSIYGSLLKKISPHDHYIYVDMNIVLKNSDRLF